MRWSPLHEVRFSNSIRLLGGKGDDVAQPDKARQAHHREFLRKLNAFRHIGQHSAEQRLNTRGQTTLSKTQKQNCFNRKLPETMNQNSAPPCG